VFNLFKKKKKELTPEEEQKLVYKKLLGWPIIPENEKTYTHGIDIQDEIDQIMRLELRARGIDVDGLGL